MELKWIGLGGLALALNVLSAPASAAPLGTATLDVTGSKAVAEQVAYRRCWRHKGHRHCRWVEDDYGYNSYPGYYGYGPGINLYFGGGGHRHHHHGHRGRGHGGHGGRR